MHNAEEAQDLCRTLMRRGVKLTINWHVAMYYARAIELYGTWPLERRNGVLAWIRFINGDTVQMASTASRWWLMDQLLRVILDNPAPDAWEVD